MMRDFFSRRQVAVGAIAASVLASSAKSEPAKCDLSKHDHDTWKKIKAFSAAEVLSAAAREAFESNSVAPKEASDFLEYYEVQTTGRDFGKGGLFVIGRMRIKECGAQVRDSGAALVPADYIHWIGQRDDIWIGGFTTSDGSSVTHFPVRFKVATEAHIREHEHFRVWSHSPNAALSDFEPSVGAVPIGPIVPPIIPPRPPPPRCMQKWRLERIPGTNPAQFFCVDAGWIVH